MLKHKILDLKLGDSKCGKIMLILNIKTIIWFKHFDNGVHYDMKIFFTL